MTPYNWQSPYKCDWDCKRFVMKFYEANHTRLGSKFLCTCDKHSYSSLFAKLISEEEYLAGKVLES